MTSLAMALYCATLTGPARLEADDVRQALWIIEGSLDVGGETLSAGGGCFVASGTTPVQALEGPARFLRFEIGEARATASRLANETLVLIAEFVLPEGDHFFRLDQVAFPPHACAYRHVHPGPGIRYLIRGSLDIHADDHTETMTPGNAWFEAANSPVRAVAGEAGETAFVRAMVLPIEFLGKPTIKILSPEDDARPKLQTNTRFFDRKLEPF